MSGLGQSAIRTKRDFQRSVGTLFWVFRARAG
jgi:hypothetical protein